MSPGRRRHIPVPLKEQMVIMHWVYRLPKPKVAELMDVHPLTVHCAVEKMRKTGSVVRYPLQSGPYRALNGIDCAVSTILRATASYSDFSLVHRIAHRENPGSSTL